MHGQASLISPLINSLTALDIDEYNVYVDHDGYIIKQTFRFNAKTDLYDLKMYFNITTSDINKTKVEIKNKNEYFDLDPYL